MNHNHHAERYAVIPRTLIFITNPNDEILLIRNSPTKRNWPNLYNGLGGHIEPGETVEEAAHREINEEAGITIEHLSLRGIISITDSSNPGILLFVFVGTTEMLTVKHSSEGTVQWHSFFSLSSIPLVPDIPALLGKCFPAEPSDSLTTFYGHYHVTSSTDLQTRFS